MKSITILEQSDMTIKSISGKNITLVGDTARYKDVANGGYPTSISNWTPYVLAKFMKDNNVYANVVSIEGKYVGYLDQVGLAILQKLRPQQGFWDVHEMNVHTGFSFDLDLKALEYVKKTHTEAYNLFIEVVGL